MKKRNVVAAEDLSDRLRRNGNKVHLEPLVVVDKGETIGYFLSAAAYEELERAALRRFLQSRLSGLTVAHDTVFQRIEQRLDKRRGKAS